MNSPQQSISVDPCFPPGMFRLVKSFQALDAALSEPPPLAPDRRQALEYRSQELIRDNWDRWPLQGLMGMQRGFVESVRCLWSWWAEHGDTLCLREPVVKVELTTEPFGEFDTDRTTPWTLSERWPAIPVNGWVLPRANEFEHLNRLLGRIQMALPGASR